MLLKTKMQRSISRPIQIIWLNVSWNFGQGTSNLQFRRDQFIPTHTSLPPLSISQYDFYQYELSKEIMKLCFDLWAYSAYQCFHDVRTMHCYTFHLVRYSLGLSQVCQTTSWIKMILLFSDAVTADGLPLWACSEFFDKNSKPLGWFFLTSWSRFSIQELACFLSWDISSVFCSLRLFASESNQGN